MTLSVYNGIINQNTLNEMKKLVQLVSQFKNANNAFSNFSESEILSKESMGCVRGGDGGEQVISIPPPPPRP